MSGRASTPKPATRNPWVPSGGGRGKRSASAFRWKGETESQVYGASEATTGPEVGNIPVGVVHADPTSMAVEVVDAIPSPTMKPDTGANSSQELPAEEGVQALALVALVVRDYDEAIAFYCHKLGFRLVEDTDMGGGKRWVVVEPVGCVSSGRLLLARAANEKEEASIGCQAGGRVSLFLYTDNFARDFALYRSRGVQFDESTPRIESFGTVAVFCDLYGNRWDLIQPARGHHTAPLVSKATGKETSSYNPERFKATPKEAPQRSSPKRSARPLFDSAACHPADGVMQRSRSSQTRPPFCNYKPKSFNCMIPRPIRNDALGYPVTLAEQGLAKKGSKAKEEKPAKKGLKPRSKVIAPIKLYIPESTSQEVGWSQPNHALTRGGPPPTSGEGQRRPHPQEVGYDDFVDVQKESSPSLLPGHKITTHQWTSKGSTLAGGIPRPLNSIANRQLGVESDAQTSVSYPTKKTASHTTRTMCANCAACGSVVEPSTVTSASVPARSQSTGLKNPNRKKAVLSSGSDLRVSDCLAWDRE